MDFVGDRGEAGADRDRVGQFAVKGGSEGDHVIDRGGAVRLLDRRAQGAFVGSRVAATGPDVVIGRVEQAVDFIGHGGGRSGHGDHAAGGDQDQRDELQATLLG